MPPFGVACGAGAGRWLLTSSKPLTRYGPITAAVRPATGRIFTTSPAWRKSNVQVPPIIPSPKLDTVEIKGPESVQKEKPAEPAKPTSLLAEQTVSNKEQRKADWAIIKDMAHYLWPKNDLGTRFRVGLSVALLVGAKVALTSSFSFSNSHRVDRRVGPECASSFLFQKHRRFHEHRFCCCGRHSHDCCWRHHIFL